MLVMKILETLKGKEVVSFIDWRKNFSKTKEGCTGANIFIRNVDLVLDYYNAPFQIDEVVRPVKDIDSIQYWQSIFKVDGEFIVIEEDIHFSNNEGLECLCGDFKTRSQFIDKCITLKIDLKWSM